MRSSVRSTPLVFRLAVLFAATLVVVVSALTVYAVSVARQNIETSSRNAAGLVVSTRADTVRLALASIEDDLQFVVDNPIVGAFVVKPDMTALNDVQSALVDVASRAAGRYTRLCVVDPDGHERVCVERSNGQPIVALNPDLQDVGARPDFVTERTHATVDRKQGRVVTASTARAQLFDQTDPSSVLRYISVIRGSNAEGVRGYVMLEVDLAVFFDPLATSESATTRFSVFEAGTGKMLFASSGLDQSVATVDQAIPSLTDVVRNAASSAGDVVDGTAIQTYMDVALSNLRWVVVGTTSLLSTNQQVNALQLTQALIGGGAIALGVIFVFVITQSIVQPLTLLTATARNVAVEKRYDVPFPVAAGSSEMRDLNGAFSEMLSSLAEASIRQAESEIVARRYAEASHRLADLTSRIAQHGDVHSILVSFGDVFLGTDEVPGAAWFDVFTDEAGQFFELAMSGQVRCFNEPVPVGRVRTADHPELVFWDGRASSALLISHLESSGAFLNSVAARYLLRQGVKSVAVIPMLLPSKDSLGNVLLTWREHLYVFADEDRGVLESLASTAAVSITARRALADAQAARQEANARARNMELVASIGKTVAAVFSSEDLIAQIPDMLGSSFGFKHVALYLFDASSGILVETGSGETFPLESSVTAVTVVARERGTAIVDDGVRMLISLATGDDLVGVLAFSARDGMPAFGTSDVVVQSALAQQIANSIVNARGYEELVRVASELKTANRLKSEFLANMSHELRTPLNSIKGYSELWVLRIDEYLKSLAANAVDPEDVPTWDEVMVPLRRISESSVRLNALVDDLLDLVRIEAGRMDVIRAEVRVEQMMRNVSDVTLVGKDDRVVFLYEIDELMPETIVTDRSKLERVMINLLSNAFKFTHSGTVHLRVRMVSSSSWELSVADSGIGIPADALEYIFDEFRQVDGSLQRSYGGTGLGLSITRELCRILGGSIRVESEFGKGSVFVATFPFLDESEKRMLEGTAGG